MRLLTFILLFVFPVLCGSRPCPPTARSPSASVSDCKSVETESFVLPAIYPSNEV